MKALLLVVLLAVAITVNCKDVKIEVFQCADGVPYVENDCNHCSCAEPGLACTAMACASHQDEKYRNCDIGTSWTKDCNKCWCTEHYGTICTDYKC